ncbi:hypothetical protein AB3R30_12460 [Leptolyngbyaceae cyanobacterium UHCC 1019]
MIFSLEFTVSHQENARVIQANGQTYLLRAMLGYFSSLNFPPTIPTPINYRLHSEEKVIYAAA